MDDSVRLGAMKNKNFELLAWSVETAVPPSTVQSHVSTKNSGESEEFVLLC